MATASTRTLLPLDRWAQILGINPLHFNQCLTSVMPQTVCGSPYKQFAWQEANQIGREDIARAIAEAEAMIGQYVGYSLLPAWVADERLPTVRPGIPGFVNTGWRDLTGFRSQVQLSQGQFISGGVEAKTLIDADVTITYSDADGDGFDETATVTFNTTVTEAAEIGIFYPVAAVGGNPPAAIWLPGGAASDAWQIRPLRSVSIVAGVCTVVMWTYQLVLPVLIEALVPEAVDADDLDNFLPSIDAYRVWNDFSQQVSFLWSPLGCGWDGWIGWSCGCSGGCASCTAAAQTGCLLANDYRLGIVHYQPAVWDAEDDHFTNANYCLGRQPDRLRVWYYAGLRDMRQQYPTLQMNPTTERAIVYLSLTLLDKSFCGCGNLEPLSVHYREDLALNDANETGSRSYQFGSRSDLLSNPFGTSRGALAAWQYANRDGAQIGKAVNW